ncbi:Hypothetical predicted protein [Paramuricea clavata]|uniref:Uncharacterized protein n=1 Tax=Paramuricea clavata TaxID=317549 RepID=A0A6S7G5I7_PARCT|nr:Hypothetical predicted protein [Paramuricea clavata]
MNRVCVTGGSSPNITGQDQTPRVIKRNLSRQEQPDSFQRSVLAKLDIMIEKQSEALSILQVLLGATKGVSGQDMLDDVLPKPIDSPEELEEMSAGLSDEDVRKKSYISWLPYVDTAVPKAYGEFWPKLGPINFEACLRVHKGIGELDVEEQIAEYLKHAPNKAGGSRYKDRKNE